VSGKIRIGHDVATAILNTTKQDDVDLVLMGWRGRSRRQDYVLGSNVDEVVTGARCDVLVERMGPAGDVDSILVPTAGGPHAEFAAEIARAIARTTGARVHVIYAQSPGDSNNSHGDSVVASTMDVLEDVESTGEVIEGGDVTETIVAESADHDLTVIGASREGLLQQLVFGAIPEAVGERAECTVIMAKRNLGITSLATRWLTGWRSDEE